MTKEYIGDLLNKKHEAYQDNIHVSQDVVPALVDTAVPSDQELYKPTEFDKLTQDSPNTQAKQADLERINQEDERVGFAGPQSIRVFQPFNVREAGAAGVVNVNFNAQYTPSTGPGDVYILILTNQPGFSANLSPAFCYRLISFSYSISTFSIGMNAPELYRAHIEMYPYIGPNSPAQAQNRIWVPMNLDEVSPTQLVGTIKRTDANPTTLFFDGSGQGFRQFLTFPDSNEGNLVPHAITCSMLLMAYDKKTAPTAEYYIRQPIN